MRMGCMRAPGLEARHARPWAPLPCSSVAHHLSCLCVCVCQLQGTVTPPIVPNLKEPEDCSYFAPDSTHEAQVQPYPSWNPELI
jgi:hypothetical protein